MSTNTERDRGDREIDRQAGRQTENDRETGTERQRQTVRGGGHRQADT